MVADEGAKVTPMLSYENALQACEWLSDAFGFEIVERFIDDSGVLIHAEMNFNGQKMFLAQGPNGYQSPKTLGQQYGPAAEWQRSPFVINGVLVLVPNVHEVLARAQKNGAELLGPVEEGFPGRRCRVCDVEGHRWMFMEWQ